MRTKSVQPVRIYGESHLEDYRETHPAYAMIGASRVQHGGAGAYLSGSDFGHNGYVTVEILGAELSRGTSNDHWFGKRSIVKVALSEAQWASFVSTLNYGQGVPCTLEHTEHMGKLNKATRMILDTVKKVKPLP